MNKYCLISICLTLKIIIISILYGHHLGQKLKKKPTMDEFYWKKNKVLVSLIIRLRIKEVSDLNRYLN
jgi:hypothetical protein